MSILKEFREFALKGNVVDLAVGVMASRDVAADSMLLDARACMDSPLWIGCRR